VSLVDVVPGARRCVAHLAVVVVALLVVTAAPASAEPVVLDRVTSKPGFEDARDTSGAILIGQDAVALDSSPGSTWVTQDLEHPDMGGGWYLNVTAEHSVDVEVRGYNPDVGTWVTVDERTVGPFGSETNVEVYDTDPSNVASYAPYTRLRLTITPGPTGQGNIFIEGYGVLGDPAPPTVVAQSPDDGERSDASASFTAVVDDPDFTQEGDTLTATLVVDGDPVANQTVTSAGSVGFSTTVDSGVREWYVRVEDRTNLTAETAPREVKIPADLVVRDLNPDGTSEVIDFQDVEVQFERLGNNTTVETLSTSDGRVDLNTLDSGTTYLAVVSAPGYRDRRVLVEGPFSARRVYLPDDSVETVDTSFVLDDASGTFEGETTRIRLLRAVEVDGTTAYRPVAGGYFGATAEFTVALDRDARYRLRIRNDEGDERALGSYTATTARVVNLDLGRVTFDIPTNQSRYATTRRYNLSDVNPGRFGYVEVRFVDERRATDRLDVRVYEQGNQSNVLLNTTYTGEYGTFVLNQTVSGADVSTPWTVNVTAYADGEVTFSTTAAALSAQRYPVDNPFGPKWAPAAVVTVTLFVGFMFGGRLATVGSVLTSATGTILWWVGWYEAGGGVVLLGLVVSILFAIGDNGRL
jgi:hypothetical protein